MPKKKEIDPLNRKIKMLKPEIINEVVSQSGLSNIKARLVVDAFIDSIVSGVKKGSVSIPGLGTFSVIKTKERTGVKPGTSTKIKIAAGKRLKFKTSSKIKKSFK